MVVDLTVKNYKKKQLEIWSVNFLSVGWTLTVWKIIVSPENNVLSH